MKRLLILLLLVPFAIAQQVNQDVIPASPGLSLGHPNQRWNGYFTNITIFGNCTFNGSPCGVANPFSIQGVANQITASSTPGPPSITTIGLANPVLAPGAIVSNGPIGASNVSPGTYVFEHPTCDWEGTNIAQDLMWCDLLNIGPVFVGGPGQQPLAAQLTKIPLFGYQNGQVNVWNSTAGDFEPPTGSTPVVIPNLNNAVIDVLNTVPSTTGDACARLSAAELLYVGTGATLDMRGFQGVQACALNPFPSTGVSNVIFGPTLFQVHQTWCLPGKINLYGEGWDNNPSAGLGATTLQATSDLAIGGANPGPIFAWGKPNQNCWTGPVIQNSMVYEFTFDCNNVATVGVQGFNNNEDAGLEHFKIVNCGGGGNSVVGTPSWDIAGPAQVANLSSCTITHNSTAVSCTSAAFDVSDINAQFIMATADTNCVQGTPCVIASVQSTTAATLSAAYTGTTVTNHAITYTNANSQNGHYSSGNIGLTTLAGSCTSGTNPPGPLMLMNTGSASNMGPRWINDMTFVINCASGKVPTNIIDISGTALDAQAWHIEAGNATNTAGIVIGLQANSQAISINGITCGNMSSSTDCILISNANTTSKISLHNVRAVPSNQPTNMLVDSTVGYTLPVSNTASLQDYPALINGPLIATGVQAALTGTGACGTITTQAGGTSAGTAKCTAATAASTLTITPGYTAPNGWSCYVQDLTTKANLLQQTSSSAAACILTSAANINQNDVFTFIALAY